MKEYNELSDSEKQLIIDWYNHPQVGDDINWIQLYHWTLSGKLFKNMSAINKNNFNV